MTTATFASGTLVVLGAVFAILGFLLAGSLEMAGIGLVSVAAGGMLGILAERTRA